MSGLYNLKKGVADSGDTGTSYDVASANGAITIPERGSKTILITKGTAAALTLGVPASSQNGVTLTIVSTTAAAHTVTAATIGFNAGNGGTDVGTFGGAIGDGFTCVAYEGEWYTRGVTNVTFA